MNDYCNSESDVERVVIRSSMVYIHGNKHHHVICANRTCNANPSDIPPNYYSWQHAKDKGWNYTKNIIFCPPDIDGVWVCPSCSIGYF